MSRRLIALAFLSVPALLATPVFAQDDGRLLAGPVVVADVSGPLDQRALDFIIGAVATPDAQIVVLRLDSPGVSSGDVAVFLAELATAEGRIAIWIGPAGATAFGPEIRAMLREAVTVGAAPGARVGYGDDVEGAVTVEASGVAPYSEISVITPTIGQFIIGLDGETISGAEPVVLETARTITVEGGIEVRVPSVEVRFLKPGLFTRFLRLASRPEATFFFLLIGLAAITFEFYAAGAGVAAAIGALSLFLAGYGFATLPMSWLGVALTLMGALAYTIELQRNQVGPVSLAGTVLLVFGGLRLTDTGPQYPPRWWAITLTVAGIALFYGFAVTTVVRARFSTRTIGREQLVGRTGIAETDFDPMGVVLVDGARWQARSHRAAGIGPGDPIEVFEVKGIMLEVGRPAENPPAYGSETILE